MVQAKVNQLQTFDDFLAYGDGTDGLYELTYGELIEVPPESFDNLDKVLSLRDALLAMPGVTKVLPQGIAVATYGQPKNRFPDLTVLRPEHPEQMRAIGKAAIALDMTPPLLIVEVVSPGSENHRRDYLDKRRQYEERGIPEYWILDPQQAQVTVLWLTDSGYEETVFTGIDVVVSPGFPNWKMTEADMLAA